MSWFFCVYKVFFVAIWLFLEFFDLNKKFLIIFGCFWKKNMQIWCISCWLLIKAYGILKLCWCEVATNPSYCSKLTLKLNPKRLNYNVLRFSNRNLTKIGFKNPKGTKIWPKTPIQIKNFNTALIQLKPQPKSNKGRIQNKKRKCRKTRRQTKNRWGDAFPCEQNSYHTKNPQFCMWCCFFGVFGCFSFLFLNWPQAF